MPLSLRVSMIVFSLFLLIVTTYILKKGRIPEKYSLLWYFISIVILIVGVMPNHVIELSTYLGFQTMSNLMIAIMLGLLTFLTMTLTVIVSGQKKKITLLIQEMSLLKREVSKVKNEKK